MRWRLEEYFKFKKQQFELKEYSKRIYEIPKFIFYALGYAMERVLSTSRYGISVIFHEKSDHKSLICLNTLIWRFPVAGLTKNGETQIGNIT